MKFVLASHNQKKIEEVAAILAALGIQLVSADIGGDISETGATFAENARMKAKTVMERTGLAAIADDSGLCVSALGGAPGVHSARYGGDASFTDRDRNRLLLQNMRSVPAGQRTAQFCCSIACCFPDGRELTVSGECQGEILTEEAGKGGFGYDPLFYVPEYGKTFGELPPEVKNRISHRARALAKLREALEEMLEGEQNYDKQ